MKRYASPLRRRYCRLVALACLALVVNTPSSKANQEGVIQQAPGVERSQFNYDSYILGPGDSLEIEVLDLPELSGTFSIGPDGTIYLPRLRALFVEGLTIQELRDYLTEKFKVYVRYPQIYLRTVEYRPIRVFVGGEVQRPGYYTLSGYQSGQQDVTQNKTLSNGVAPGSVALGQGTQIIRSDLAGGSSSKTLFPTVFDAIRTAQGITPYSDLTKVQVIRKRADGQGGGRIQTYLDFLSLITDGNESQNIRLFDGDVVKIRKSPVVLKNQILKAGQSNLTPQFMSVFVSGRVNFPGEITLPQGSSLNQAISLAGGPKPIRGKIEFIRFNREGTIDRRVFPYKVGAVPDAPNNPILTAGDIVRINDSLLSGSINTINELSAPFIGIYSLYSLFNGSAQ